MKEAEKAPERAPRVYSEDPRPRDGEGELGELARIDEWNKFGTGDEAMSDEVWADAVSRQSWPLLYC